MVKDSGATFRVLKGEEQGLQPSCYSHTKTMVLTDTGGLRVSGIVKTHMIKLQKKFKNQVKETNSRKVRAGYCCPSYQAHGPAARIRGYLCTETRGPGQSPVLGT